VLNTEACAAMGRGGEKISAPLYPHFYAYFPLISKFRQNRPRLFPLVLAHISLFLAKFVHKFIGFVVFAKISNFYPRGKCCFFRASFFFFHHPKKNSQNI